FYNRKAKKLTGFAFGRGFGGGVGDKIPRVPSPRTRGFLLEFFGFFFLAFVVFLGGLWKTFLVG
ncbi:hypothetical protein, partial [Enterobacter intestinihominis]